MVQHDSDRQRKSLVIQENTEKMLECLQAEVKARILFLPIFLKCCIPFCFRVNSFKGVAALERFAAKQLASQDVATSKFASLASAVLRGIGVDGETADSEAAQGQLLALIHPVYRHKTLVQALTRPIADSYLMLESIRLSMVMHAEVLLAYRGLTERLMIRVRAKLLGLPVLEVQREDYPVDCSLILDVNKDTLVFDANIESSCKGGGAFGFDDVNRLQNKRIIQYMLRYGCVDGDAFGLLDRDPLIESEFNDMIRSTCRSSFLEEARLLAVEKTRFDVVVMWRMSDYTTIPGLENTTNKAIEHLQQVVRDHAHVAVLCDIPDYKYFDETALTVLCHNHLGPKEQIKHDLAQLMNAERVAFTFGRYPRLMQALLTASGKTCSFSRLGGSR